VRPARGAVRIRCVLVQYVEGARVEAEGRAYCCSSMARQPPRVTSASFYEKVSDCLPTNGTGVILVPEFQVEVYRSGVLDGNGNLYPNMGCHTTYETLSLLFSLFLTYPYPLRRLVIKLRGSYSPSH
jgi:hypothetical protein